MTAEASGNKLSVRTKGFYGVGDVGNALVNSALQFFLLIFYTDAALLAPAVVGSALLIGKIWDAINDPLFGWVSDRTGSKRFGKRHVYMIFGAIRWASASRCCGSCRADCSRSGSSCGSPARSCSSIPSGR